MKCTGSRYIVLRYSYNACGRSTHAVLQWNCIYVETILVAKKKGADQGVADLGLCLLAYAYLLMTLLISCFDSFLLQGQDFSSSWQSCVSSAKNMTTFHNTVKKEKNNQKKRPWLRRGQYSCSVSWVCSSPT